MKYLNGLIIGTLCIALAGLIGCGKKPSTEGESGAKTVSVGFSQIGAESAWRTANTQSVKEEAEKRGIRLVFSDSTLR